jgi:hypothetical protein
LLGADLFEADKASDRCGDRLRDQGLGRVVWLGTKREHDLLDG